MIDEIEVDAEAVPTNDVDRDRWFEWQLRTIREIKAEQARNIQVCEEETADMRARIAEVEAWRDGENEALERQVEWRTEKLRMAALGYDFGAKKSRSLPSGKFGFRTVPEKLEVTITDKDAALAFALSHSIPVKVAQSVGVADLKVFIESTDVVPDGCVVNRVQKTERFEVTV